MRDTKAGMAHKVLVVTPELDFGGVESSVRDRAVAFARLAPEFEFEFACFNKAGSVARQLEGLGFKVHHLNIAGRIPDPRAVWKLASLIRATSPDLVHSLCIEANFHSLAARSISPKCKFLAEEVGPLINVEGLPSRSRRARRIGRWNWARADAILAISRATEVYLRDFEGAPPEKIRVIHHFVDIDVLTFAARSKKPGRLVVICVGRLSPEKGQIVLLEAVAKHMRRERETEVWLVGDGPDREKLERAAAELGIKEKVRFLGMRPDVAELLREADIFDLPSLHEGLGIAILEAQAAGVPVVASDVGGVPEVVSHGETGFLVPAGDAASLGAALERVAAIDDLELERITRQARCRVEAEFSPAGAVDSLRRLYLDLLR